MKRALLMVSAALLLLTQCRKPSVEFPVPEDDNTVNMTVTVGLGRTIITPNSSGEGDAATITWSEGDRLYVAVDGKYKGFLTLIQGGGGSATGTFRGNVSNVSSGSKEFHFFYLGSGDYTSLADNATEVVIDFSSQTGNLVNLSGCHVGHGSADGSVDGSGNVTFTETVQMTSKVAIAYFGFKNGGADYAGALTLGGTNICNAMTVNFNGVSFTGKKVGAGGISLTSTASAQKYVMLVPTGSTSEETLYFGGVGVTGSTTLYNGIVANKLYRKADGTAIGVLVGPVETDEWVDFNDPSMGVTGLPIWSKKNLGATCSTDNTDPLAATTWYGDYYAWGEVEPYATEINWTSATSGTVTEWCAHPSHSSGVNFDSSVGYVWKNYLDGVQTSWDPVYEWNPKPYDETTKVLKSTYDAATSVLGGEWRMPTGGAIDESGNGEWQALFNSTLWVWTTSYRGITNLKGYVVYKVKNTDDKGVRTTSNYPTSGDNTNNGGVTVNSRTYSVDSGDADSQPHLFFPAAGYFGSASLSNAKFYGYTWSSTRSPGDPSASWHVYFTASKLDLAHIDGRRLGHFLRAVQ